VDLMSLWQENKKLIEKPVRLHRLHAVSSMARGPRQNFVLDNNFHWKNT